MKKKLLIILLVIALVASAAFGLLACNDPKKENPNPDPAVKNTVNITILPDMVDYGADSKYYADGTTGYSDSMKNTWTSELEAKQEDERKEWYDTYDADYALKGAWPTDVDAMKRFYVSFGAWADDILSEGEVMERQSNVGYFDNEGNWLDDESANTVTRIFTYGTAAGFITRMDKARVEEHRTDGVVKYIVREDEDRAKGQDYNYTIGVGSALEDYAQLEELETIYEDVGEYRADSSYSPWIFVKDTRDTDEEVENRVEDAINRKKRKIYGEIFKIFEDKADQFARCAIAMVSYAIEIIDSVMIPAYNNEFDATIDINDYMREEVFDHETLSYLLAFMDDEITRFNTTNYEAVEKKTMMSLYGYYYQYQKRDYEIWDDNKKVNNSRIGTVTEYEDFLELGHHSYFDGSNGNTEALRYRDYDRRQYEKAYRYSAACYQKYYTVQLTFQERQEEMDTIVFVGGAEPVITGNSYENGQYGVNQENGITTVNNLSYSEEMQRGCAIGLESTLKISDVNWEYTGVDDNALNFNKKSVAWNGLSTEEQAEPRNKIKKVELEIVQLKSQDYTLNHGYIKDIDLTQALQYQIRAYSADSIRSIQATKKDEVTYYLAIDRFLAETGYTYEAIMNDEVLDIIPKYAEDAFAELEEDAGRNDAKFINVDTNYTPGTIDEQERKAQDADWKGIRSNVKETLAVNYQDYAKKNDDVDTYFEDTLIKKEWSCGCSLTSSGSDCPNGDGHATCTKKYDTDWATSRLLDTHEVVLRYMAGQAVVTFKQHTDTAFSDPKKFHSGIDTIGTPVYSYDGKKVNGKNFMAWDANDACVTVTLGTSDEIGSACCKKNDNQEYPVAGNPDSKWNNIPEYEGANTFEQSGVNNDIIKVTISGVEYIYTFIGWYVDENFKYPVLLDETYNYDIRLYPGYRLERVA